MIKKISYFIVFVFSLCFLNFVNAETINVNEIYGYNFSDFNDFINMSDNFSDINDIFNSNYEELDFDICFINHGYPLISCFRADLDNLIYDVYNISIPITASGSFSFYSSSSYSFSSFNDVSYDKQFVFYITDNFGNIDIPIWVRPGFVYNGDFNVSFNDEYYQSLNPLLKQNIDFRNYLVSGNPIITYFDLFIGKETTKTINLNVCINDNCDLSKSVSIDIKYKNGDDELNIKDFIPKEFEGYVLDDNRDYLIIPNDYKSLDVYYYSERIDYKVYFYFDNELQNDRTSVRQGFSGTNITIDNLDDVIDKIYFLDTSYDYSFILSKENNFINIYYHTIPVNYYINVYLDDIYYQSHSIIRSGLVGEDIVIDDLEESINIYNLDVREYKLSLVENEQLNYVNVYYFSNNYNTKYQDIDTSDKFYISFDWVYIKELFNLKGEFTQTEQFIIVYVVNFLFYGLLFLISYFAIKLINKLFSLFDMF